VGAVGAWAHRSGIQSKLAQFAGSDQDCYYTHHALNAVNVNALNALKESKC